MQYFICASKKVVQKIIYNNLKQIILRVQNQKYLIFWFIDTMNTVFPGIVSPTFTT